MFRFSGLTLAAATLALTACAPQVPDSGRGVGFESYSDYMRRRDGQLSGPATQPMVSGPAISTERVTTVPVTPLPTNSTTTSRPRADTVAGVRSQSGETVHYGGNATISDEQNFDAVASRESIQSDAERIRRQREQYVEVAPTALPERSGEQGPNIVQFAVSTRHAPGTRMYTRGGIRLRSYESACGPFSSADLAQEEFLRRGGPERDPLGVDPDGDGFACGWDPRPFRAGLN